MASVEVDLEIREEDQHLYEDDQKGAQADQGSEEEVVG